MADGAAPLIVEAEDLARLFLRQRLQNGILLTHEALKELRDPGFTGGETPC